MKITGSCLCRSVRFAVNGPLEEAGYCHCSLCRKWSGSALLTYAGAKIADFEWIDGGSLVDRYRSSEGYERIACRVCHSSIAVWPTDAAAKLTWVMLGLLDDAPNMAPTEHIFVGSKLPWYEIHDELPQFARFPTRD